MKEKAGSNLIKDKLVTMIVNGVEKEYTPEESNKDAEYYFTDKFEELPCSCKERGIENYRAAIVIGPDGIVPNMSVTAAVSGGKFDDYSAENIKIESTSHDFSGIIVNNGKYIIKDSVFKFITNSDGSKVSDFTGIGSLVAVFKKSKVFIRDSELESIGVAKCGLFCDGGSDAVLENCRLKIMGGKLYDGYVNSADGKIMVSPPWVLGISGNARATNLVGEKSSTTAINCDLKASRWGVMSTDAGKNTQLILIDSDITLLGDQGGHEDVMNPYWSRYGSGYGAYIIDNATEEFHGVNFRVGTYTVILRGGSALFKASNGPMKVTSPSTGEVLYEGQGKGRQTVIESDTFGCMAHGNGVLTFTEGTKVNTHNAVFLIKSGGVTVNIEDNAMLNTQDGVILQVMDDDDTLVGLDTTSNYKLTFKTDFYEKEGWPSENGQTSSKMEKASPTPMPVSEDAKHQEKKAPPLDVYFNASDTKLNGALYNGSGYFGQTAKKLHATLGQGCVLDGAISATEVMHVDEKGKQNTHFTKDEYYYLGHVANRPFFNGNNNVAVELSDGAVWNVTDTSIINDIIIGKGCILNGEIEVDGRKIKPEAGKSYSGMIIITPNK